MTTPSFTLTPKMQAQIDTCPLVGRSNSGCFAARPQVQVSAELPRSYALYAINGATYTCPSVTVRVSVPDFDQGWGFYDIVWSTAIPRHEDHGDHVEIPSNAVFQARVQAVIDEATAIALRYRGA